MTVEIMKDWDNVVNLAIEARDTYSSIVNLRKEGKEKLKSYQVILSHIATLLDRYNKGERSEWLYQELSQDWGI